MRISSLSIVFLAAVSVCCFASFTAAQSSVPQPIQKGATMSGHATGPFEVNIKPLPAEESVGDPTIARMSLDKQFHGDLEATSKGQMLSTGNPKTSAVYVAIERVSGTLKGRKGTFALHHTGIMTSGAPSLTITVVPDSGTDELTGLSGTMAINIAAGKHSYDFTYTLPAIP